MPDVLYFGIGLDEDGYFYAVAIGHAYKVCPDRFSSMDEATTALMEVIERTRVKMKRGGWLN